MILYGPQQDPSLPALLRYRRCLTKGLSLTHVGEHLKMGVWGTLTAEAQRIWIQSHSDVLRLLLQEDRWQGDPVCPSVYEVCGATGVAFPIASLTRERIWHACRLVQGCHTALWELLCWRHCLPHFLVVCTSPWFALGRPMDSWALPVYRLQRFGWGCTGCLVVWAPPGPSSWVEESSVWTNGLPFWVAFLPVDVQEARGLQGRLLD